MTTHEKTHYKLLFKSILDYLSFENLTFKDNNEYINNCLFASGLNVYLLEIKHDLLRITYSNTKVKNKVLTTLKLKNNDIKSVLHALIY